MQEGDKESYPFPPSDPFILAMVKERSFIACSSASSFASIFTRRYTETTMGNPQFAIAFNSSSINLSRSLPVPGPDGESFCISLSL